MFTSLRNILLIDAATCLAAGAVMAFGASFVAGLTQIPPTLLLYAGVALFPIAAFMAFVATRATASPSAVWLIIIGNAGWVVASVAAMIWVAPNALGYAFIAAQAIVVAVLTKLEYDAAPQTAAA